MLAEVWETSSGLLFLASVPGRWRGLQLSDQTEENTGPPAAGERGHDGLTKGDDPVPVTIVRVLLETPDRPRLIPVKCRDHPEMSVDTAAVHRKAIQAQQAQFSRRPVVSVAAVGPAVQ